MLSQFFKSEILKTLDQLEPHDQQRVLEFAHDLFLASGKPRDHSKREQGKQPGKMIWDGGESSFRGH